MGRMWNVRPSDEDVGPVEENIRESGKKEERQRARVDDMVVASKDERAQASQALTQQP